ncbi:MAG: MscL family protein [Candidatus Thorarchaeota archaeon]|nr:MscL family protein [Candidatus Thorarchaeota archaeon]
MSNDEMILEELKEIRKLLTPSPPDPEPKNMMEEFTVFLKKYRVIGFAVAFILAIYLGALIQSFVYDIIMPVIGLFVPSADSWANIYIPLTEGAETGIMIGLFAGNLLTFIIMAFIMFLLIKLTTRIGLE